MGIQRAIFTDLLVLHTQFNNIYHGFIQRIISWVIPQKYSIQTIWSSVKSFCFDYVMMCWHISCRIHLWWEGLAYCARCQWYVPLHPCVRSEPSRAQETSQRTAAKYSLADPSVSHPSLETSGPAIPGDDPVASTGHTTTARADPWWAEWPRPGRPCQSQKTVPP